MGLPEILSILTLVLLCGVAVLLFVYIKKASTPTQQNTTDDSQMTDLLDTVYRLEQEMVRLQSELKNTTSALRTEFQEEGRKNRSELSSTLTSSSQQLSQDLRTTQRESFDAQKRELTALFTSQETQIKQMIQAQNDSIAQLLTSQQKLFDMQDQKLSSMQAQLKSQQEAMQTLLVDLLSEKMEGISQAVSQRISELSTTVSQRLADLERQFKAMLEQNRADSETLRKLVAEQLKAIQEGNQQKLEEMRKTVDEKLQATLNQRISQSFETVSKSLAEVQQGLGEMRNLATNVGDLKKVMSGVKTRGILGEIQLGAIIEELMNPEQYETNIPTIPKSQNRVEYAIRLPGEGGGYVYLPIDAKFPADAYQQLLDAYETADADQVKAAKAILTQRIKSFAKDIHEKYIEPPHTTRFGIMFLPTEGLYAEVVRMGLVETLQHDYNISVAGPTTLAALLNSLQMGFRTLAIQKRSNEVWEVLGAVKTEFSKFQKVLEKAQDRIRQTDTELTTLIGTRTNQMNRKLRSVEALPEDMATSLLDAATDTTED